MEFKEQLKSQADIVGVAGEYVRLLKAGPNRYKGLCPFHTEKSPSFTVHADKQFYKCFGCGAGGDVFDFVMKLEGITFYEALKLLAERYGIPMPKRSLVADEEARVREAVTAMHEAAQENFRANLAGSAGEAARAYLERRGLAAQTVEQFGLGYSERSGRAVVRLLEQRGFAASLVEQSGLAAKRPDGSFYDRFRNRLMFPIHDEKGKVIGFGGRALAADDEPKYLNSPETPIYKKSRVLYNLHRAKSAIRKEDRAILVEGYMDAIGVAAAGFESVVASCGTALTSQQVQMLRRHSQRIVVNFDPDAAGANAAERSIGLLLAESMHVRIMELDGDLDPDEYCKQRGADAYRGRLEEAKGYFYWLADRARSRHDVHTQEGVAAVLDALLPALRQIADPLERSAIANDMAAYVGVDRGIVLDRFRKAAADRKDQPLERPKIALRADERLMLNALLDHAEMQNQAIEELKTIDTVSRLAARRIFQAMFALHDGGGRLTFDAVHARLEEGDQSLLADAVLRDDMATTQEEVHAAIASLRRSGVQQQRDELKTRIKERERAGDWQEALRLTGELQDLEKGARSAR